MRRLCLVFLVILIPTIVFADSFVIVIKSWNYVDEGWVRNDILTVSNIEKGSGCKDKKCSTRRESYADFLYNEIEGNNKGYIVEITWYFKEDLGSHTKKYKFKKLTDVQLFLLLFKGHSWIGKEFEEDGKE